MQLYRLTRLYMCMCVSYKRSMYIYARVLGGAHVSYIYIYINRYMISTSTSHLLVRCNKVTRTKFESYRRLLCYVNSIYCIRAAAVIHFQNNMFWNHLHGLVLQSAFCVGQPKRLKHMASFWSHSHNR